MLNNIKKILTIVTITSIAIPILLLIGAIFGLEVFSGFTLKLILSLATIAIAGAFSINAVNIYNKKQNISIICLALLGLSTILGIIIYWSDFTTALVFNNLVIVLAMATVLFCIIVSMHIKLQKKHLPIQIITYCLIIIIDIMLTLIVFGIDLLSIDGLSQIFWVLCLVTFALLCTTAVLSKKSINEPTNTIENDDKYIKITKKEYENLKNRIKELENQLNNK